MNGASTKVARRLQPLMTRWHLDAPADARVLVWAEQGYGDAMQFVRYVPMVKARDGDLEHSPEPATPS